MPKSDQGVFTGRYQIIPRTLIFVIDEDRVLLLLGAPDKRLWANRLNGIGGHVERGEDVLSAARRELQEETGLFSQRLWLCGTVMVDASDTIGIGIYVFRCEFDGGVITSSKEGALGWYRQGELSQLPLVEDLTILLPRVFAMTYGQPPFAARSFYDDQDRLRVVFAET